MPLCTSSLNFPQKEEVTGGCACHPDEIGTQPFFFQAWCPSHPSALSKALVRLQSVSPWKASAQADKVVSSAAGWADLVVITSVKKGKSTLKASKQASLSPEEARRRRQANPAKHIQPIPHLDSDNSDIVIVGETQLAPPSADFPEENNLLGEEVDELWPDTLRPSLVSKSLMLAMLNIEVEEAAEGDNEAEEQEDQEEEEDGALSAWEDSPLPKRVEPKGHKAQPKGKGKAKAPSRAAEPPLAAAKKQSSSSSQAKAHPSPPTNVLPLVIAVDVGSSADIFGSPVNAPIAGDFDSLVAVDSKVDGAHALASHAQLLNDVVFTGFPTILANIVAYLQSQGIISRLQYSKLLPKYMACDKEEGCMPKLLDAIVDSLLFHGYGVYVNPLTADPTNFRIVNKKVMFKLSTKKLLYPVFIMLVIIKQCNLLAPVQTNERFQEDPLCLTGWIFEEVFSLFSTFIGSPLDLPNLNLLLPLAPLRSLRRTHSCSASPPITVYDLLSRPPLSFPTSGIPTPLVPRILFLFTMAMLDAVTFVLKTSNGKPSLPCWGWFAILLGSWVQKPTFHDITEQNINILHTAASAQATAAATTAQAQAQS
ncbi:hypothetical protein BDN71DRAFT_1436061 [Pleurotus eryngii]|uniref:Uncharacterized protein n=1 Tax=Pleurotus eryngii TaxID=5323 RepID=A0A9P5ZI94_PLEER|nr:hypothetical protein BDN71DRAFT_1436061 [Pleurotus eryngii]